MSLDSSRFNSGSPRVKNECCKICDKTVYMMEELKIENNVYHKACFKCYHCSKTLKSGDYTSIDGKIYCRPHFLQLFRAGGSYSFDPSLIKKDASVDTNIVAAENASKTSHESNTDRDSSRTKARPVSIVAKNISAFSQEIDNQRPASPRRKARPISIDFKVVPAKKCTLCEKPVYAVEELKVDGKIYHKGCFKCTHCGTALKQSNFVSFESKLYCRAHYEQWIKPNVGKRDFDPAKLPMGDESVEKSADMEAKEKKMMENKERPQSILAKISAFNNQAEMHLQKASIVDKGPRPKSINIKFAPAKKCVVCDKTVYMMEEINIDNKVYHKSCFKCAHCGSALKAGTYTSIDKVLYCRPHFIQLFKAKGKYDFDPSLLPSASNSDEETE